MDSPTIHEDPCPSGLVCHETESAPTLPEGAICEEPSQD